MNWLRISLVILFAVVVLWLGDFFMDVGLAAKDHCLIWSKGTTAVCTIGFIPKGVETVIHRRTLLHMFVGEIQVDNFSPQVLQSVLILLSALGFSSLLLWRSLQYIKAIRRDFRYESTPTSKLTHEPNDEPTEHASMQLQIDIFSFHRRSHELLVISQAPPPGSRYSEFKLKL